jgi:hypothetical protein
MRKMKVDNRKKRCRKDCNSSMTIVRDCQNRRSRRIKRKMSGDNGRRMTRATTAMMMMMRFFAKWLKV